MKAQEISSISDLMAYCKDSGFVFPSGEIYGGMSGFWDFGPKGVELKENIKRSWWQRFVRNREDIVGIDGAIITHPKTWKSSGHASEFTDYVSSCQKCKMFYRADHLIEDVLHIVADDLKYEEVIKHLKKIKCPKCKGALSKPTPINLMFKTEIGPISGTEGYLRPETAQLIFTNYLTIQETSRTKLPFGIAQMGKAFRNEISPRDFLFRSREFEQMEIEYFVHPDKVRHCPILEDGRVNLLSAQAQHKKKGESKVSVKTMARDCDCPWLVYWIYEHYKWLLDLGINPENLRIREHLKHELAHYATSCFDIEYNYPFGWKEMMGFADRGDFDLNQHTKGSGKSMTYFDQATGQRVTPVVAAEPSLGVERLFLALILDAYTIEKVGKEDRLVLKLKPELAPIQVAVFPLVSKDKIPEKAREIFNFLKDKYITQYDSAGSIGRRYRRMDEVGTPNCITIDHQTLKDNTVTVRNRDSMKQVRVKYKDLGKILNTS